MNVNEKEIVSVSNLSPIDRYKYFIKKVVDWEKMYSLKSKEGEWEISELENHKIFSLWSAPEFAQQCLVGLWKDSLIQEITMEEFEKDLVSLIKSNQYLLNIFSIQNKSGFVVTVDELIRDLSEEDENYQ